MLEARVAALEQEVIALAKTSPRSAPELDLIKWMRSITRSAAC
jgi:hypothetical protein